MSTKAATKTISKEAELLQKILIVNLAVAGVPQNTIKKIVGVSSNLVSAVAKHLKKE